MLREPLFAAAAGAGGSPHVKVYAPGGSLRFEFLAYGSGFTGGVRVATGDVDGDGIDDIITGDAAVGFASVTPARGVVIVPMAPLGLRDRETGTVTITTSLGLPKKLIRLRETHGREH